MGIIFKNLPWAVTGFNLKDMFVANDASIIVLKDQKSKSLLGFNTNDWTISEVFAENEEDNVHFIEVLHDLYKICEKGCVFQFTPKNNDVIFGSDSSVTEPWTKISETLGHVVQLAGITKGFIAIVKTEEFFYLKLFTITESVCLQATARLPICSKIETNWLISGIRKVSPDFVKHFFKDISLVFTDLVLVSCPNGFVLIYAVINDSKFSEPVPIFWDNEMVSFVEVTPCGRGLILFFKSGKIVFIVLSKSAIQYNVHYLSSKVIAAAVVSLGTQFHVVWSDSVKLFYFGPVHLDNLLIQEFATPLKGIICLAVIGCAVLAGNVNKTFYQISFNNSENISAKTSLKALTDIGTEVEKLRNELLVVNNHFEALQSDGSKIVSKVSGQELILENLSLQTFKKNIWELEIESSLDKIQFVKKFQLDEDFVPSCVLKFPLIGLFTEKIDIRLIGKIEDTKLLFVNISSVIVAEKPENFFNEINNILKYLKFPAKLSVFCFDYQIYNHILINALL